MNLTSNISVNDFYVQNVDTDANLIWAYSNGSSSYDDYLKEAAMDQDGNIIICGYRETFSTLNTSIFVHKIDSTGAFLWERLISGSSFDKAWGIDVDENNNIYTTGNTKSSSIDMDPGPDQDILQFSGSWATYVNKLSPNGDHIWAQIFPGTSHFGADELIYHDGFITISGYFQDTIDLDPTQGQNIAICQNQYDDFLVKMDTSGIVVWNGILRGDAYTDIAAIAFDNQNHFYFAGRLIDTVEVIFNDSVHQTIELPNTQVTSLFKIGVDPCMHFSLIIDSVSHASCSQIGFANSYAVYSNSPTTYTWSTTPITNDSIAYFSETDIYTVNAMNDSGCVSEKTLLINGPMTQVGFDNDIHLVTTAFRTGFDNFTFIDGFNNGCVPSTGQVSLVIDTSKTSFNYSIPPPDQISGDTLKWNFTDLKYDSTHILSAIYFTTNLTAQIGDSVFLTAIISPLSGDTDSLNNKKEYVFPVVNGYDPNDKKVHPVGECIPHFVDSSKDLTYTVRFQNTGNSEAININIVDSLPSSLDINTLEVLSSSHFMYTEISSGNVAKFIFNGINLPDSTSNPIGSIGYVIYKVQPNSSLANGTLVENKAHIFFDFNPAIVTNEVFNTISDDFETNIDSLTIEACDSLFWEGSHYFTNGIYQVSYQNIFGCDSIRILDLTLNISNDTLITIAGLDSISVNNQTYYNSGIYQQLATNSKGCDSLLFLDLSIGHTGINASNEEGLLLSPNPTSGTIHIASSKSNIGLIRVLDPIGNVLFEKDDKTIQTSINLGYFPAGIYFIQIGNKTFPVVLKK